jgi:hypothetical protein
MFKPVIVLLAVAAAGLGSAFLLFPDTPTRTGAILGLAITLPPALFSMLAVVAVAKRWPQLGVTVIAAGSALRMGWAVVAVAVLGKKAEVWETTSSALAGGTTAFYLLLLAAECVLLWGWLDGRSARRPG